MKEAKEVSQILEIYKSAVYEKDVEAFLSIYDDQVEIYDMWGPAWNGKGLSAWRQSVEGWFGSIAPDEKVEIGFENVQTKQGSGMAFVSAFVSFTAVGKDGVLKRSMTNRLTAVAELKNGAWKIVHEHTSAPVDMATMKVSLKR